MRKTNTLFLVVFLLLLVGCSQSSNDDKKVQENNIVGEIDNYIIIEEEVTPNELGDFLCGVEESKVYHISESYFYLYNDPCNTKGVMHYVVVEEEKIPFNKYIEQYSPSVEDIISSGIITKNEKHLILGYINGHSVIEISEISEDYRINYLPWYETVLYSDEDFIYSIHYLYTINLYNYYVLVNDERIDFKDYLLEHNHIVEELLNIDKVIATPKPNPTDFIDDFEIYTITLDSSVNESEPRRVTCDTWEYIEYHSDETYSYIYKNPCISNEQGHYVNINTDLIEFTEYVDLYNPSIEELISLSIITKIEKGESQ